jgi:hypothetical protein
MMTPTRIVIARAPKRTRLRKAAQAAAIVGPRVVVSRKPEPGQPRLLSEPEIDPVETARVRAFLKRMLPNHPLLQDD